MHHDYLGQGHARFDKAIIYPFNVMTITTEYSLAFMKGFKCP